MRLSGEMTFTHQESNPNQLPDELADILTPEDFPVYTRAIKTTGDGNCLFHATSLGLSEIHISRYDYSESQCGKSYCDANIAHMRGRIRQFVAGGNNVRSGTEMKTAIDSFGGVVGCQPADACINVKTQTSYSHSWKGITKINNLMFNRDGSITTWRAYDIGKGALLSKDEVSKMCSIPQTDTGFKDGFKQPNILEGKMKHDHVPTESNNRVFEIEPTADAIEHESVSIVSCPNQDSFHCPEEGCTIIFQTFNGLELHQIFGKHKYVLSKSSTYDEIKIKWKHCCESFTENMAIHRHCLPSENQAINVKAKRWALRKDRKVVRFSEKVKTYLRGMFDAGAHSGNKINPMDVARNMRVCAEEDGNKMCQSHAYLQQGQVASYFSRPAVMAKVPASKRKTIDDVDLETVVAYLNTVETIEIINHGV